MALTIPAGPQQSAARLLVDPVAVLSCCPETVAATPPANAARPGPAADIALAAGAPAR